MANTTQTLIDSIECDHTRLPDTTCLRDVARLQNLTRHLNLTRFVEHTHEIDHELAHVRLFAFIMNK